MNEITLIVNGKTIALTDELSTLLRQSVNAKVSSTQNLNLSDDDYKRLENLKYLSRLLNGVE